MTKEREFTRRRWIQAATAAAGATALSGCIGDGGDGGSGGQSWRNEELAAVPAEEYDSLYEPGDDEQSGETVNHLTWTGYDASNVQDPFRNNFDCDTQLDLFTSNPKAFNRLNSGEWEQFHQATFDMAWLPDLAEAGLIRPLNYEEWKPYTFDKYTEMFTKEGRYKFAFLNEDDYSFDMDGAMYGVPQRYGWASFVVNKDNVAESDYSSYDAAWSGDYNVGIYDLMFWGMQIIMLREGIDPYKEHTDEEIEQVRQATFELFDNAKTLLPDFASMNQAMKSGEIDIGFISGSWINGTLRRGGGLNFEAHVPEEGGVIWVETTCMLKGDHPSVSDNYLAYMQQGETAKNLMWPTSGGTNVVPHQTAIDELNDRQREVLRVDDIPDIVDRCVFYTGIPDLDKFEPIWREAKTRV
jgi:spermidine/putrescine transport system substrate-binding protein